MDQVDKQTLGLLSSINDLSDAHFSSLLKHVFGYLCRNPNYLTSSLPASLISSDPSAASAITRSESGLLLVISDFARQNAGPEALKSVFEEVPLSSGRSSSLSDAYAQCLPLLRTCLINVGGEFGGLSLVAFDWRLDYRVRSSGTGENVPVFMTRFTLKDERGEETVREVECSLASMKDMLYKVQQATTGIKKIDGGK